MKEPRFVGKDMNLNYKVESDCVTCGKTVRATLVAEDVFQWRQGWSIQQAFHYVDAATRETLFLSGICGECWVKQFA